MESFFIHTDVSFIVNANDDEEVKTIAQKIDSEITSLVNGNRNCQRIKDKTGGGWEDWNNKKRSEEDGR